MLQKNLEKFEKVLKEMELLCKRKKETSGNKVEIDNIFKNLKHGK